LFLNGKDERNIPEKEITFFTENEFFHILYEKKYNLEKN